MGALGLRYLDRASRRTEHVALTDRSCIPRRDVACDDLHSFPKATNDSRVKLDSGNVQI
jgi:hypothetical protein